MNEIDRKEVENMYAYSIIGWLNILILLTMTGPFWMRFLNNKFFRFKGGFYIDSIKTLRKIHKPLGITLLILGLLHGYLALGTLRIHTGSLLWISMFITAILGVSFYKMKKKPLFLWHKRMALITVLLLLLHLGRPWAI